MASEEYDPAVVAAARRGLREGAGLSLEEAMKNEQALSASLRDGRERKA